VLAFVATLFFSQSRLLPLGELAIAVNGNATPSVEALAMARGKLVTILLSAHAAVDGGGASAADVVTSARKDLHDALAKYEALPPFPGEEELASDVALAAGPVEASLKRALQAATAGDKNEARRIVSLELHPAVRQLDDALAASVAFNAGEVQESMTKVRESRRAALKSAWTLGGASVFLASLSALAALYALRSQAKLTAERNRLLSERAAELETFAGRVAHDLRGPLSAMLLRLTAAERKRMSVDDVGPLLSRLRDRATQMVALVEGLFEFAVAGAQPTGACNVDEAVSQAARGVELHVAAAGASLTTECETNAVVRCSRGVLTSILSNLLGNAAKYVVDGAAAERLLVLRATSDASRVYFEVCDNGPGIPIEDQPHIFDPFVRVGGSRQPGTGIGLATVKRLVSASGGHIGVRSTIGVGTCFQFDLPRKVALDEADCRGRRTS
jgi:signal transduction histidine kinase